MINYLGVFLDSKLSFNAQISLVMEKLSRQCGILSKLRHYVPRGVLLDYFSSNVKPIVQYGVLIYGGVSFSSLEPIRMQQLKILRVICLRKKIR